MRPARRTTKVEAHGNHRKAAPVNTDPLVHANRWKTLAVLALSLVIIGLDNTILNVALPTLQNEFHAPSSELQWMVDSYLLVFPGPLPPPGAPRDRVGPQKTPSPRAGLFWLP